MTRALIALALAVAFLTGAMVGATYTLAAVGAEEARAVEDYTATTAAMRVACVEAVAWAEDWRGLTLEIARARVGPTETVPPPVFGPVAGSK